MSRNKAIGENRFNWPVTGHQNIITFLQHNIITQTVAHAYLFFGADRIGKKTLTKYFVASLVCENQTGEIPCGQCQTCRQLANQTHPDIIWLSPEFDEKTNKQKNNITIEQIRQLQSRLKLHSFFNAYKIAVITQAESLTQEAANALLKTLEEPTKNTVLILLTNNLAVLPLTIISRCQLLKFLPVSQKDIVSYLVAQKADRATARNLAALAAGLPGLAINYYHHPELIKQNRLALGEFCQLHQAGEFTRFKTAQILTRFIAAAQVREILIAWTIFLRDILLIKTANQDLITNNQFIDELKQLSNFYSLNQTITTLKDIGIAQQYLAANVSPKLVLENIILNLPNRC